MIAHLCAVTVGIFLDALVALPIRLGPRDLWAGRPFRTYQRIEVQHAAMEPKNFYLKRAWRKIFIASAANALAQQSIQPKSFVR